MGKIIKMAWRNVWRNGRRTLIAVIAIALGLAFLIFFDGVFAGSGQAIFGNAVKLQGGNIMIHAPGYFEKAKRLPLLPLQDSDARVQAALTQPQVVSASRRINTSGMLSSHEGTLPTAIIGFEPEAEAPVGLLADKIVQGRYLSSSDEDQILIGRALAERLEIAVGDRVTLVGRARHEQMRRRTMTVVGIYDMGLKEIEKGTVYISLAEAQTLFDLHNQVTEVVVSLQDIGQEPEVVAMLRGLLPGFEVHSWDELSPELRETMDINAEIMGLVGLIVLLIAGVGILNLMMMAVFERTREIGLLAALGLKRVQILTLFLIEGVMIGILGAFAGGILGSAVIVYLSKVGIAWATGDYSPVAALLGSRLYPSMDFELLVSRILMVGIITALASLYPAWQASHREPAEALHFV